MTALDLLELYWKANHTDPEEIDTLQTLAAEIIQSQEES